MQYALLIYQTEAAPEGGTAALGEMMARHMAFSRDLGPKRLGGAGLKAATTATTVRTQGGAKAVHDGPFAETREQLAGFYLIEAADLDAAIATARNVPLRADGAVEIRPLLTEVN